MTICGVQTWWRPTTPAGSRRSRAYSRNRPFLPLRASAIGKQRSANRSRENSDPLLLTDPLSHETIECRNTFPTKRLGNQ
jgi:hypothetical protein